MPTETTAQVFLRGFLYVAAGAAVVSWAQIIAYPYLSSGSYRMTWKPTYLVLCVALILVALRVILQRDLLVGLPSWLAWTLASLLLAFSCWAVYYAPWV